MTNAGSRESDRALHGVGATLVARSGSSANGQEFKVARVPGGYSWNQHAKADRTFVVLEGELVIQRRDGEGWLADVRLGVRDLCVVPMGVEYRPRSEAETLLLIVEPSGVVSRGS